MNNFISILRRSTLGLLIPISIISVSAIIIWQWPTFINKAGKIREIKALFVILPFLPYVLLGISGIMGWRYNNAGLIFSSTVLALVYFLKGFFGKSIDTGEGFILDSVFFLLPLNIVYFSFLSKRRLFAIKGILYLLPLTFQTLTILLLLYIKDKSIGGLYSSIGKFSINIADFLYEISMMLGTFLNTGSIIGNSVLVTPAFCSFVCVFIFLLGKFFYRPDAIASGMIGILAASFLGINTIQNEISFTIYFFAAGLILIITTTEASFKMAYIDDLTGLPGRRSLNEMLLNLGNKYTIAMVDVDYFKKFNDTYGHETGDQVLKMLASQFSKMTGGAKSFRYGGEEFTAIFTGKFVEDALPHLEKFRKSVQNFPFIIREKDRPKAKKKSTKKRKMTKSGTKKVQVTVSIGVSGPEKVGINPELVIKNADKALYKAKKSGRNCVESW